MGMGRSGTSMFPVYIPIPVHTCTKAISNLAYSRGAQAHLFQLALSPSMPKSSTTATPSLCANFFHHIHIVVCYSAAIFYMKLYIYNFIFTYFLLCIVILVAWPMNRWLHLIVCLLLQHQSHYEQNLGQQFGWGNLFM